MKLLSQCAHNLVAVEPAAKHNSAAAANEYNSNDGNNESGIVLLGFFDNGGHLVVHDFFSCLKK